MSSTHSLGAEMTLKIDSYLRVAEHPGCFEQPGGRLRSEVILEEKRNTNRH